MRKNRTPIRLALALLALAALSIGLPATFAPESFYDDFPLSAGWVSLLPPYNRHLITDVGSLYLGFAVLFVWAAWTMDRTLTLAACSAWLLVSALHLTFHATNLTPTTTLDTIAQLGSIALIALPALAVVWAR